MAAKSIKVTFPDGSVHEYHAGITAQEIVKQDIGEGLLRAAVAATLNGAAIGLADPITEDGAFTVLTFKDDKGKEVFWHSSAHILAIAVLNLFPKTKLTIGPPIEQGFYYDFEAEPFTPEDLLQIEKEMEKVVKEDLPFTREEIGLDEAKALFKDNSYKTELIEEHKENKLTTYRTGQFIDLCRGPHLPRTGMVKAVKLTKASSAYWRGDAKKQSLQRIYGVSYPDKKDLKAYLALLEEAEKRDHKRIGREMGLFMIAEMIGKGLPVWLPKGETLKRTIEEFAVQKEKAYGFVRVSTPHLAKEELFLRSGHLPHYADSMYPKMQMDDGAYYLKAMNCPMHHLVFSHEPKSYRDMPMRIAEYGTVYRNELSGTLAGLLRVRMLSMNDAHIYCTKEQIGEEVKAVIKMIKEYYEIFGFRDYSFRLSLWDRSNKEKYIDEPDNWTYAEDELRKILKEMNVEYREAKNEAAFYGPKIDVQFRTALGREETMSTVQLDFAAKSRFNLRYTDKEGNISNEVFVIHRAPLSTHERFIAFLIEQYAGRFPLWLAPVQVKILTVADRFAPYAKKVAETLEKEGIRTELDTRTESVGKKVREAQIEKVPVIVNIGEKEEAAGTVAVRTLDGDVKFGIALQDFVGKAKKLVEEKSMVCKF